ncbi:MAG: hypothetical protein ACOX6X_06740 [Dethiobacteria bacterium]|jgi:hypothetical protein
MQLTITQTLLYGIPENFVYALFCLTLLNHKLVLNKIFIIAVIQTAIYFFVRALPLPFGLHTLFGIFTLSFLLKRYTGNNFSKIFVVVLITFLTNGIIELLNITTLGAVWGKETVFENENFSLLVGFFQLIYLFAVTFLVIMIKKKKQKKGTFEVPEQS